MPQKPLEDILKGEDVEETPKRIPDWEDIEEAVETPVIKKKPREPTLAERITFETLGFVLLGILIGGFIYGLEKYGYINLSSQNTQPTPTVVQLIDENPNVHYEEGDNFQLIDLPGYYVPVNLGLEAGEHELNGIPFLTGNQIDTTCNYNVNESENSYTIPLNINNPLEVYILIQSGWARKEYEGDNIGNIVLKYEYGGSHSIDLILGYNIRDWTKEGNVAVKTITSPNTKLVWSGETEEGVSGGIDMLKIPVPEYLHSTRLFSITINDTSEEVNPCIHITGVTVKHNSDYEETSQCHPLNGTVFEGRLSDGTLDTRYNVIVGCNGKYQQPNLPAGPEREEHFVYLDMLKGAYEFNGVSCNAYFDPEKDGWNSGDSLIASHGNGIWFEVIANENDLVRVVVGCGDTDVTGFSIEPVE